MSLVKEYFLGTLTLEPLDLTTYLKYLDNPTQVTSTDHLSFERFIPSLNDSWNLFNDNEKIKIFHSQFTMDSLRSSDAEEHLGNLTLKAPFYNGHILETTLAHITWCLLQKVTAALPSHPSQSPFNKVKEFFKYSLDEVFKLDTMDLYFDHAIVALFTLALTTQSFTMLAQGGEDLSTEEHINNIAAFFDQYLEWDLGVVSVDEALDNIYAHDYFSILKW
ncbi:hypothetical protein BJ085DRAFT_32858 [Dimargaris cristalligena]|uniref:Uncharacterized protein n=1 Tax=Dimargaris cristalligena TaxID=215637 RepID=A0A4P9ZJV4_9FUNG|nr:hypothetical protein BJ085DRAFT_32858 [Dimargaris cristalligena]|eukprot:RKP33355.1 hypothetical protein BJ085DRAFT_32858 [Dimargaris cristalligena]